LSLQLKPNLSNTTWVLHNPILDVVETVTSSP
jgi:hypothetical protein